MIYDLDTASRRRSATRRRATRLPAWLGVLSTVLMLVAILGVAAAFRTLNIVDWDGRQGLHPDERFIAHTVYNLGLPRSIGAYFDSATSPLNPRNHEWSRLFVYGTLPTTLTRVTAAVFDRTRSEDYFVVGRGLSTFFDLVTCAALFFLGRRIYGRTAGLLAAALYAVTVMPIQQSHFFTTDNFAVAFTTLALLAATRLALDGRWRDAIFAGICIGGAIASKINLAALGAIVGIAVLQFWLAGPEQDADGGWEQQSRPGSARRLRAGLLLALAGFMTLTSFRVFQPDAFRGPQIWNILPDARFLENIGQVRGLVDGSIDYPPSHQWAMRTPYLFPWQNMVVWGMGLPLGLMAWSGFLLAGLRFMRPDDRRRWRHLVPWTWVALYFAWQGGGFNPSLRYFLPIYPPLILFGAWGALAAGRRLRGRTQGWGRRTFRYALPATLLLLATTSWAWAFTRIYTRPHTRIAAGNWMVENAPHGSNLTTEQWDDPLPYTNGNGNGCNPFCLIETKPYAEDEPVKFFGGSSDGPVLDPMDLDNGLIGRLDQADYVVLSSARVYSSVERLPHRFPATLRYYEALFDGSLGFELVADFHSFPTLFGLPIPDLGAEEQFHVYDHPRVLIFRRTEQFNAQRAREIITGGIVWDEIYRISARTTSDAPTALRVTERAWQRLQDADARYLFDRLSASALNWLVPAVAFLLSMELLGLAALGILWRFRVPLPDRGVLSSRLVGLLLFGVPPALLAVSGLVGVSRMVLGLWFGLVLGFGLRLAWFERENIRAFLRNHRGGIWVGQALYAGVLLVGLLVRSVHSPAPGPAGLGYAPWAALLRSPVLPPPDPLFAGGQLVVPYAAVLPFGMLARLAGVVPSLAFNLTLAALGASLLSLVVVLTRPAAGRSPDREQGWPASSVVALIAVALVLAPVLLPEPVRRLAPLGMLVDGDLATLATLVLAVGALVLGRGYAAALMAGAARPASPRRSWLLPALLGASLALVHGQDRWAVIVVLISLGMVTMPGATYAAGLLRSRVVLGLLGVAIGMLVGGHLFAIPPAPVTPPAAPVSPDSARLILSLAVLLLLCVAAWGLTPVVLANSRWRRTLAAASGAMAGLLLVLALSDALLDAYALRGRPDEATPALQGAADALVEHAQGMPVVATAPQAAVPAVIARSGLPALLAAPATESSLRSLLGPSVNNAIVARDRALGEIYGPDAGRATSQLGTYQVQYILLGPDERAIFGPDAGTGLRQLVDRGELETIYRQDDVTLYRYGVAEGTPPYVARRIELTLPSLKTGMLDRPLRELPVVDEYGWNRWAAASQPLAVGLWIVLFEVLGLLAWPLTRRIFGGAPDLGWAWSKLVGLLVWGYAIWLPVSLHWWTYTWRSLVAGLVALSILSWLAAGRPSRPRWNRGLPFRDLLRFEAIFLGVFGLWTLVRAANPDLWHPWLGGEKPFEFGMLNAIVRSPVMPPPDPFFSGGIVNYYYYGVFLVSVPIRATGIDPAIAFNLIIALLCALAVVGATAVVRALTGSWRWGLVGALFATVLGPVASAFAVGESRGLRAPLEALRPGIAGWTGRVGDWFWGPSRVIPHTINEFPLFSYLFADLHPHMIALPITLLLMALAIHLGRGLFSRRELGTEWPALLMAGMVLGTLAVANSWDAPTAALVLGGALAGRAWRSDARAANIVTRLKRIVVAAGLAVGLLAGGLLLYLPFFMQFRAMVGGIGRVREPDSLVQFAVLYGTSLYVVVTLLAALSWLVLLRAARPLFIEGRRRGTVMAPIVGLSLGLGAWAFAGRVSAAQPEVSPAAGSLLPAVLIGLVCLGLLLAFVARLRDEEWLTLWLITAGLMVALGVQIVFVRDHLAGGDWERMNTVFKFGLQVWTLLAVGAAAALPLLVRMLRRAGDAVLAAWCVPLLVLVLAGMVYPLVGIPSRSGMRFSPRPGLTLDGLAFMETARYEHEGRQIDLGWDADAIRWLKRNLQGLPIVLQSEGEFYRNYGVRIAANTGFPTVLGRLHQDEQRPAAPVRAREADVKTIYSTADPVTALDLLAKYEVDYVYVGQHERFFYGTEGLAKWDTLAGRELELVYENPGARIYRVRPGLEPRPQPLPAVRPPEDLRPQPDDGDVSAPVEGDADDLAELEAAHRARPGDGSTAFGLASRYVQAGRLDEAAAVLSAAAPSSPRDVPLHHLLGDIQAELGRADEAVRAWQAAVDADPSSGNISKLGTGLTLLGRYDEAERALRQAMERDPGDVLVHFYLAEVAFKRNGPGDAELARQEYALYLEQSGPDSPFRAAAEQALRQLGR